MTTFISEVSGGTTIKRCELPRQCCALGCKNYAVGYAEDAPLCVEHILVVFDLWFDAVKKQLPVQEWEGTGVPKRERVIEP